MELSLSANCTLSLITDGVTLRGARPVLNGKELRDWSCEIKRSDDEKMELCYRSPGLEEGAFWLQATRFTSQDRISIQYWVEDLPQNLLLDSFGLRFEQVENLRQFLRNGYFSWDGSYYVQPDSLIDLEENIASLETGYGMCQFLPRHGSGCLILGFDRRDRFQQTFTFDLKRRPPALTIQTLWDNKDRSGLARCESEKLVIFSHEEIENGLREWARIAASSSPTPPRLVSPTITGWCSWYPGRRIRLPSRFATRSMMIGLVRFLSSTHALRPSNEDMLFSILAFKDLSIFMIGRTDPPSKDL